MTKREQELQEELGTWKTRAMGAEIAVKTLTAEVVRVNDYVAHLHSQPVRVAVVQCLMELKSEHRTLPEAEAEILRLMGVE